jgi:hypothetical protein
MRTALDYSDVLFYVLYCEIDMTALKLDTRKSNHVANFCETKSPLPRDLLIAEDLKSTHFSAKHRPTNVCYTYNCHGVTFASRRSQITSSAAVRTILSDDGYVKVSDNEVIPGDIILYIAEDGDIEHSGVVLNVQVEQISTAIQVLSKWGSSHEVIHLHRDCPYAPDKYEYYRITA